MHLLVMTHAMLLILIVTSEMEQLAESMDPRNYIEKYPFENLVFEGGGAKGIAYPGALKVRYFD